MMHIALIAKSGHANTGVGRYVVELSRELRAQGHRVTLVHPVAPLPKWMMRAVRRGLGWDLATFFNNYPVWARYPQADIYHISSQNLATLMLFRRPPGKTVITVHDIIPWMTRHDPELCVYRHKLERWVDWLALWGLERADDLLADSVFTAQSLQSAIRHAGVPPRHAGVPHYVLPVDAARQRVVSTVMLGIR